jgi:hypothetical protein
MFVHTFCIACHQKLEDPAKDGILSARIFICAGCTPRRRFQHLLGRRKGIIGLAAAMALTNPSYNFRQYKHITTSEWDEWPQLNEDISNTLCHPIRSLLRQNAFSRALRSFQMKLLHKACLNLILNAPILIYVQKARVHEGTNLCSSRPLMADQFFLGWASDAKALPD